MTGAHARSEGDANYSPDTYIKDDVRALFSGSQAAGTKVSDDEPIRNGAVSDQTRANRQAAGRKAANAKKAQATLRAALKAGLVGEPDPATLAELGPAGRVWGSAPIDPAETTIPAILARLRARDASGAAA